MNPSQDQAVEQSLYAKHEKIYPREVHGLFARFRVAGVLALLGLYYSVPWWLWDGRQAVLFDLPERKFYILNMVFWPQDFIYLTLMLVVAALSLFFFTALAGRLWCGYACPQTVWTEVFLWIERKIEGGRPQQMRLDKMPWNLEKVWRKGLKQFIWVVFSLFTGYTFVGYFTPIRELTDLMLAFNLGPWETFWIFFYSLATYGNAGWLREQVCTYMCPYARFQSAMLDKDTLIISYDKARGEPRGARKRSVDPKTQNLGSCIDCTICVQVCPTGIDIRDGLQYECIGCAACIDACDDVMDKMGYEKGLVRYTTENSLAGKKTKILRPRIMLYALILVLVTTGVGYAIYSRTPLQMDVIRDRNVLFRETDEGLIQNVYTLKLINMDEAAHRYKLEADGIEGMVMRLDRAEINVGAGEVVEWTARLEVDPYGLKSGSSEVTFYLQALDNPALQVSEDARFIAPVRK